MARFSLAVETLTTPTLCARGSGSRGGCARRHGELQNAPREVRGVCRDEPGLEVVRRLNKEDNELLVLTDLPS